MLLRFCSLGLTACVLLGSVIRAAPSPVLISEFMASNTSTLADEDDEYSDWIELFNGSSSTVNLAGWALTDDAENLSKWQFPATSLPWGGYLMVFASNKNRQVAGRPLHTNFKLEASGEYLALVEPGDTTIASQFTPGYPPQVANVSHGIIASTLTNTLVSDRSPGRVLVAPGPFPTGPRLALTTCLGCALPMAWVMTPANWKWPLGQRRFWAANQQAIGASARLQARPSRILGRLAAWEMASQTAGSSSGKSARAQRTTRDLKRTTPAEVLASGLPQSTYRFQPLSTTRFFPSVCGAVLTVAPGRYVRP